MWGATVVFKPRSVWGTTLDVQVGDAGGYTSTVADDSAIQAFITLTKTRSVWGTGTNFVDATSIFINGE